jgi:hypothetical protein
MAKQKDRILRLFANQKRANCDKYPDENHGADDTNIEVDSAGVDYSVDRNNKRDQPL